MSKKKIAVLGSNAPLIPFYRQAKQLGYEIHSFSFEKEGACKKYADYYYPVSFAEREIVLKECERIKIDGITSFSLESALPTVNFVAKSLNLPGNPEICLERTADKFAMVERLKECGINVPDYVCIKSEKELSDFTFCYPQIVKPVDSGGKNGVSKVYNKEELIKAFRQALLFSKSKKVVIGQFIDGREFSVESISHQGQHHILSITDKVLTKEPYFVEIEHHQPAILSDEEAKRIKFVTRQVLDALSVYSSASHTEIKMDKRGDLYVIETGARAGGGMTASDLVRLSTGYDFVKGILELTTGDFISPVFGERSYAGAYFLTQQTIYVNHFILNSESYPQIVQKELYDMDIVLAKRNSDRAGYFVYQSSEKFDIGKYSEQYK